jgi:transposase
MSNNYQKWSHFSDRKYRTILSLFSFDINAKTISEITGVFRPAINRFWFKTTLAQNIIKQVLYLSMVNKYLKLTHISERKFREILKYFCCDIDATTTSKLSGISRNSINKIFNQIRVRISEICEENSIFEKGEIELG